MFLSRTQRFTTGFLAGLLAGIVATLLMIILSVTVNGVSLPEVFGSALTGLLSPSLFTYLHNLIGGDAKHYLFYIIVVGQCLVFALSGGLCNLLVGEIQRRQTDTSATDVHWTTGVLLALILWVIVGVAFLPLTGAGLFGSALGIGLLSTMLSLAVVGATFGVLFVFTQNWLMERRVETQSTRGKRKSTTTARRDLLINSIQVIGVGVLGVLAWRFITSSGSSSAGTAASSSVSKLVQQFKKKIVPPPMPNYSSDFKLVPQLSSEITPNDQYYVVSKNLFSDPTVDGKSWRLSVTGQVQKSLVLTYDALLAMPTVKQYESMMCISNDVGGQYMSNALWEGVPLADLLTRAGGVVNTATKVVIYAADDYSDSIHLSKALEPTTLLAIRMNGQTLPQGHGFPVRLLVPGIYGMKHVKWITRIDVVNSDYQGYWQQRGWSDEAPIRLTARIDTPLTGTTLKAHTQTSIAGVAFSGNKGISEVDVSLDEGQTWQRAILKRPFSDLTWVLWELAWQPTTAGTYNVLARAIDLEGNVQDPNLAPPAPDGSSGYHTISLTVQ